MPEIKADASMEGRRIYSVLRREMMMSASLIKRLKWSDGVRVNGEVVHMRYVVREGDIISAELNAGAPESDLIPEDGALDILFENEFLLAVNKPAGMIVHPTRARNSGTLANFAAGYLGGACHVVNRLDRDTSGIVLFAKDPRSKALAIEALRAGGCKEYYAVCFGSPAEREGVFDAPIKRVSDTSLLRCVSPDGVSAVTYYSLVAHSEAAGAPLSLLNMRLGTGRTHQIRVHSLAAGIPLLGDPQYCTDESAALSARLGYERQLLHAYHLSLTWPDGGEAIDISAPIVREDMRGALRNFFPNCENKY